MDDLLNQFLKAADSRTPSGPTSLRTLVYARVSTEDQEERGLSIPAQVREIEEFAERQGIEVAEIFREAASGYQDEHRRIEFWKMMERAKSDRTINTILVHEFSRFCRDPWKTPQLVGELQAHGVQVISVSEPRFDLDTIQGMWLQKVTEAKNASYSMEIAMHTRKGMRENIRRRDPETGYCYKNGGKPIFGLTRYRVQRGVNKRGEPMFKTIWQTDETIVNGKPVQQWARECLMMAMNGASLDKIRDYCNDNGVPASRKEYWASNTWFNLLLPHCLLQFAGYGVWNVRGKHRRFNPPSEWIIVEDAHAAVLTMEEAEAIRKIREDSPKMTPKEAGTRARSTGSRFMLSGGLFTCASCGANMVGFTGTNGKGRCHDYYVCGTAQYRRGLGCGKTVHIDKDTIEQTVWDGVADRFREWSDVESFAQTVNEKIREMHTQHASAGV